MLIIFGIAADCADTNEDFAGFRVGRGTVNGCVQSLGGVDFSLLQFGEWE